MNLKDFRYGFRILWKSPVYALVSVLTLALGIGASTASFLRSLPYYKPEEIVRIWEVSPQGQRMRFADPNLKICGRKPARCKALRRCIRMRLPFPSVMNPTVSA
jgi:hypothetical protein